MTLQKKQHYKDEEKDINYTRRAALQLLIDDHNNHDTFSDSID